MIVIHTFSCMTVLMLLMRMIRAMLLILKSIIVIILSGLRWFFILIWRPVLIWTGAHLMVHIIIIVIITTCQSERPLCAFKYSSASWYIILLIVIVLFGVVLDILQLICTTVSSTNNILLLLFILVAVAAVYAFQCEIADSNVAKHTPARIAIINLSEYLIPIVKIIIKFILKSFVIRIIRINIIV